MIEYKGGKCEHCPLELKDSHPAVFDFHHLDSDEKDLNFNGVKGWKWERIIVELDKCSLLCSNCHRIEHYEMGDYGKY